MSDPSPPEPQQVDLELSLRDDRVAVLELRPRRGASLPLHLATLLELEERLAAVERAAEMGEARALVLRTLPPRPTLPGYDLDEIRALRDQWIVAWSQEGQRVLRRLEKLPIPSIALVQEPWLGGAAELALACSYRVATDTAEVAIGFPQTRLGFIPAWGGTVRLPRLIGLRHALDLILSGRSLHGDEAERLGLIDQLLAPDDPEAGLARFVTERTDARRKSSSRKPIRHRLLDETAPGRRYVAARAGRKYLGSEAFNRAGKIALELITETVGAPLEDAFRRESVAAGELIVGTDAQGRIHSERLTDRAARRTPLAAGEFQAVAIVGAGDTGADLAHLLLSSGIPVRIKDDSLQQVRSAVARVHERLVWEKRHGRISDRQAERRSARARGATGYGGFGTLDVVFVSPDGAESTLEGALADLEPHVRPGCLIVFQDWSASPSRAQLGLQHPERLIGMMPSLPADRFPLVEIVPGTLTSADSLAATRRLARKLGLSGLVVSDQTPTPGVRLLATLLAEATLLLEEGVPVAEIDDACLTFGFELGPLQRIDAIGAPRVVRLLDALGAGDGDRPAVPEVLREVARSGTTFYAYRAGRPTGPNPGLPKPGDVEGMVELTRENITDRIVLALINEAAAVVESGAVVDAGDLEIISIYGLGFPRERGGILFHAEEVGLPTIVDRLQTHAERFGARFAPVGVLRDLALASGSFFGEGYSASGHSSPPMVE